jgi:hypothetical protein
LTVFVRFDAHSAEKPLQLTAPHAVSVAAALQIPALPGAEQVSQTPLQAELQHTPSTQMLPAHSEPVVHA